MPAMAIFRRSALTEVGGFAAGFDASADYDLYLRIARAHQVHDHGVLVAAYRRHDASMSSSAQRMLQDTLAVMLRHRPDDEQGPQLEAWREGCAAWRDFYGTQLTEEIRLHVRRRQVGAAFTKACTLARYAPAILRRETHRKLRRLHPADPVVAKLRTGADLK